MKTIILSIALLCSAVGAAGLGVWGYRNKVEVAALQATVARQEALIKELAAMETVGITITNSFKSTAVMGTVTVTAAVENNARQVATILRGELAKGARSDTAARRLPVRQ
jgi:hypothetical protein